MNYDELSLNLIKFLKKKKLKMKNTIIMDNNRYRANVMRSDDFIKLLDEKKNFEEIKKIFLKHDINEKKIDNNKNLFNFLLNSKVIIKLDRFHDVTDTKKYKWPKKMEIHNVT